MRKIIVFVVTLCFLFMLVSCSDKEEVANELIQYNNKNWVPINEMKESKLNEFKSKQSNLEKRGNKEKVISLFDKRILPTMDDVLGRLQDLQPTYKEVKKLNDMQINAEKYAKSHFDKVIIFYQDGDVSEEDIDRYSKELRKKYQEVLDYRDELIDKYNLEYVEDDTSLGNFRDLKRQDD